MNRRIETPQRTAVAPPPELAEPTEGTAPTGEKKRRRRNERNAAAYDDEVCELLQAIDKWRRKSGRSFPAWSEVLQLLKELGWKKVGASAPLATALPIVEPLPPPSQPPS